MIYYKLRILFLNLHLATERYPKHQVKVVVTSKFPVELGNLFQHDALHSSRMYQLKISLSKFLNPIYPKT